MGPNAMPRYRQSYRALGGSCGVASWCARAGDPFVAFALDDTDDNDHLILSGHLVHRHLLLQPLVGLAQALSHYAYVHLDLHEVGLLF